MKKHFTLLLLAVFSIAAFTLLPAESALKAKISRVMYTSTINSSETTAKTPKVKITPKKKSVKKATEVATTDTKGVNEGTEKKTVKTEGASPAKKTTTKKDTSTGTKSTTTGADTKTTKKDASTDATPEKISAAEEDVCGFDGAADEDPVYSAQVITVRKKFRYSENEEFQVKVYVKNTGNMPWFSQDSKCVGARVYLGTTRETDRTSKFYNKDLTGWVSPSRVRMDASQMRVNPGEAVAFIFNAKADEAPSVYREFFAPVVDGVGWLTDAEVKVDIYTGTTTESAEELRKKLLYAFRSMRVNDMQVEGDRKVEVDLSDQMAYLKIDDYVVREFKVSTGKSSTPTPTGNFKILLKNEVRIGHESPHYIMPKFQMFTAMGAGLHALPSLGNDGGVFWTEAQNHIGIPVSHGCVRMLPEDASFTFEFTEVGDKIEIHW